MTSGNVSTVIDSYNRSSRTWSGADTPKGQSRTEHDYTMSRSYIQSTPCKSAFWNGTSWVDPRVSYLSGLNQAVLLDWSVSPNLVSSAWNDLGQSIKGTSFNTGLFLSQLPMAVNQVAGSALAVIAGLSSLRRGDLSGAIRSFVRASGIVSLTQALKRPRPPQFARGNLSRFGPTAAMRTALKKGDISGTWLAMQYGVLPTIADIYELCEFIEDYHAARHTVVKKRKAVKRSFTVKKWRSATNFGSFAVEQLLSCSLRASFVERPPSQRWAGQFDPFVVAWELVPFSFVFDWFMPIGTFLENTAIFRGMDVDITRTLIRSSTAIGSNLGDTGISGGTGRVWTGGSVYENKFEIERKAHVPIIVPLPAINNWSKAFSLGHMKNAGALFHQQARSFR